MPWKDPKHAQAYFILYRLEHLEEIRRYDRERDQLPHRRQAREEYARTHRASIRRQRLKAYHSSPEIRARACANAKRWRKHNPARHLELTREWEREKRRKRPYYARIRVENRRARHYGAPGELTEAQVVAKFRAQRWRCALCGKRKKLEIHHIRPLKKGGSNWIRNVQGVCHRCNRT